MDTDPADPVTPDEPEEADATVDPAAMGTAPTASHRRRAAIRASAPARFVTAVFGRVVENLHNPLIVLLLILIASVVLRVLWLDLPRKGLIFDEAYYVQAARTLLGWTVPEGAHYAGSPPFLDPNTEHPPLGKLLMAASMAVFGDNGIGWRLPSVIAGLVSLVAVYGIVRSTSGGPWLGVLAVFLLAFDNLTMVHGRIGTLDMLVLAPILVSSWLALRRHWALAGLALAVGLLIKLTAIYALGAVILVFLFHVGPRWWRHRRIPLRELRGPLAFVVVAGVVSLAGLALLDARFTSFATPFDHIQRMVEYGSNLRAPVRSVGICPGADSRPWSWLFNECQIQYLRVDVTVRAGETVLSTVPRIDFRGALNPLLAGAIPLAMLFGAWYAWRARSRTAQWAMGWAAANYLPYIALALATRRIMYLYYFLPVVPAVAVALAILLLRAGLPRPVRWGFIVAYAIGFAAYFPFRQVP
jgi:dolichyl-phosphate-mannose-protein mannosyltransferase